MKKSQIALVVLLTFIASASRAISQSANAGSPQSTETTTAPELVAADSSRVTPGGATFTVPAGWSMARSEAHTSELQSRRHLVCRLLLEKKNTTTLCVNSLPVAVPSRLSPDRVSPAFRPRAPCFFFKDRATAGISTFPLHGAFPI